MSNGAEVIGNTVFANNIYVTGGGGGEAGIWIDDTARCLVEDNVVYYNAGGIKVDGDSTLGTMDCTVRGNLVFENQGEESPTRGGSVHGSDHSAITINGVTRFHFYNNTVADNGLETTREAFALLIGSGDPGNTDYVNVDMMLLNNIWVGHRNNPGAESRQIRIDTPVGSQFTEIDHNIYYDVPDPSDAFDGGTFAAWQGTSGVGEANSTVDQDPLLSASPNYVPQFSSPAIGTAAPIATVSSTNLKVVSLDRPGAFWPGDWIEIRDAVGTIQRGTGRVDSVDIQGGTITLKENAPAGTISGDRIKVYGLNDKGAKQT